MADKIRVFMMLKKPQKSAIFGKARFCKLPFISNWFLFLSVTCHCKIKRKRLNQVVQRCTPIVNKKR